MSVPLKPIVITGLIFVILLSIITLIFSFTQVKDSGKNLSVDTFCDTNRFYYPFRISVLLKDTDIEYAFIECVWSFRSSFIRCTVQFLNIFTSISLFYTYSKNQKFNWTILNLFLFSLSILGIYSFGSDAKALRDSYTHCDGDEVSEKSVDVECVYSKFYGTLAFSVISTIIVLIFAIVLLSKRSKLFSDQNNNNNYTSYNKQPQQQNNNNFFREEIVDNNSNNTGAILVSHDYPSFEAKSNI